jgi:multidrug efflux system outer membrane protein
VGVPASIFSLEKQTTLPFLPEIPPGVPAAMLKRRPDIRQQVHLMDAAILNVGVAKTEYFPDFTITLDYGFASSRANKLFKWKSHTWLAAVDVVTPLFTAGRIASTIDQTIAQYKQQVASYINTVLIAFQEVEDAIYSIYAVKNQLVHLHADVIAATEGYEVADIRYRMGLENYILVVDNERTMLDAQRAEIQIQRSQYSTTISLIRSLGGGWGED